MFLRKILDEQLSSILFAQKKKKKKNQNPADLKESLLLSAALDSSVLSMEGLRAESRPAAGSGSALGCRGRWQRLGGFGFVF